MCRGVSPGSVLGRPAGLRATPRAASQRRRWRSGHAGTALRRLLGVGGLAVLSLLLTCAPLAAQAPPDKNLGTLTLADCVVLALRNNLDVRSAYLNRIVQRFGLRIAEYAYEPQSFLQTSSQASKAYATHTEGGTQTFNATTSLVVPTGGKFGFTWGTVLGAHPDWHKEPIYNSAWQFNFIQPLLKGGGLDPQGRVVALAPLTLAWTAEAQNVLALKQTLIGVINTTAQDYRAYVQAQRQLEISRLSLERAKQLVETNRELIRAGRMAEVELVQADADIANRELSLLQAQNSLEAARLTLVQVLNIDRDATFSVVEEVGIKVPVPSVQQAVSLALENRPDYLSAVKSLESAKLSLAVAARGRLWDLSFGSVVGRTTPTTNHFPPALWGSTQFGRVDWTTTLTLTIPIRDLTIEQAYVNAKVGVEQAALALKRLEINVGIDVTNAVRDAEIKARQVDIAAQARQLAEQKLRIEAEKLRAGRSSNFQIVSFQNDLVTAQVAELDANVAYLNALTQLDNVLGTTLQTWRIEVSPEDDAARTWVSQPAPVR